MEKTFADLGIPFPLFEAPIKDTSDYCGLDRCVLCERGKRHCFRPSAVAVTCPSCSADEYANRWDYPKHVCKRCRYEFTAAGEARKGDELQACYDCLRAAKAIITKDTVLGGVGWEQAWAGMTHGVPGLRRDDFEMIPAEDDPEWIRAVVPSEHLWDLLRTPKYSTWQGEIWQFCCQRPMIFVGVWKESDFDRHADDGEGKALFDKVFPAGEGFTHARPDFWNHLREIGGPYMFRCGTCGRLDGHYDMD